MPDGFRQKDMKLARKGENASASSLEPPNVATTESHKRSRKRCEKPSKKQQQQQQRTRKGNRPAVPLAAYKDEEALEPPGPLQTLGVGAGPAAVGARRAATRYHQSSLSSSHKMWGQWTTLMGRNPPSEANGMDRDIEQTTQGPGGAPAGIPRPTNDDHTTSSLPDGVNAEPIAELRVGTGAEPDGATVPIATLVHEPSVKLVEARQDDLVCFGRLGRRTCILLALLQLVVLVIAGVVTAVLVNGNSRTETSPFITVAPAPFVPPTSSPTTLRSNMTLSQTPTFQSSDSAPPSIAPSQAPSDVQTEFPVPDECYFRIDITATEPPEVEDFPTCQFQPTRLGLLYTGGTCNRTIVCLGSVQISCQDFPENGDIQALDSSHVVVRSSTGGYQYLDEFGYVELENGGIDLNFVNFFEIHRGGPPFNETTILQRTAYTVSCTDRPVLCFNQFGSMTVNTYSNNEQGFQNCVKTLSHDFVFQFTISLPPKLPEGEEAVEIEGIFVETNFTFPPIRQFSELKGNLLSLDGNIPIQLEALFDSRVTRGYSLTVFVIGRTVSNGLPCETEETLDFFGRANHLTT